MGLIAVYTTVDTLERARAMARELVERKFAACAQITEIESFYRWEGDVRNDREFRLMLKTTHGHYACVEAAVKALHPYDLPAIFSVEVADASDAYRAWVHDGVATPLGDPPPACD
jgi:periplasmic divalent cation tolerance protein